MTQTRETKKNPDFDGSPGPLFPTRRLFGREKERAAAVKANSPLWTAPSKRGIATSPCSMRLFWVPWKLRNHTLLVSWSNKSRAVDTAVTPDLGSGQTTHWMSETADWVNAIRASTMPHPSEGNWRTVLVPGKDTASVMPPLKFSAPRSSDRPEDSPRPWRE